MMRHLLTSKINTPIPTVLTENRTSLTTQTPHWLHWS